MDLPDSTGQERITEVAEVRDKPIEKIERDVEKALKVTLEPTEDA